MSTGKQGRLARFWAQYFTFYDTLNLAQPYRSVIERHAALLGLRQGDHVLDAGTGTGNVAAELAAQGARIIGIDFCPEALDICRQKLLGADFRFADLTRALEFPSETFDHVTCCWVLHLLEPPAQASVVREFFRVLKPGGRLAVTVFATGFRPVPVYLETLRQHRKTATRLATAVFAARYSWKTVRFLYYVFRIRRQEQNGQYKFLSREELHSLLASAGFEVLDSYPVFARQSVTAVARKPQ